ncbi:MAG: peptidase S41, partial [Muribaculaceae bacterium]|nr:peptidase S41 [Muribaculaceae bacterium]
MEKDEPKDPVSVFDYLWNKVDQQYAFFDVKGVDWDSVYEVYRPKVNDQIGKDSLFRVCATMLNTLQDGHTNLISSFDVSRNDSVY